RTTEDGEFTGVSGTLHDISDRKQIENTLALSELRFKAVFEHAGMGIVVVLPDGRLLSANPAFERMLGVRDREVRGKLLTELAAEDNLPTLESAISRLTSGDEDECRIELRCKARRREALDVRFHGTLIRDNDLQPLLI